MLAALLSADLGVQATSISPWVVTLDALEPFRCPAPLQNPPVLPYLQVGALFHSPISNVPCVPHPLVWPVAREPAVHWCTFLEVSIQYGDRHVTCERIRFALCEVDQNLKFGSASTLPR